MSILICHHHSLTCSVSFPFHRSRGANGTQIPMKGWAVRDMISPPWELGSIVMMSWWLEGGGEKSQVSWTEDFNFLPVRDRGRIRWMREPEVKYRDKVKSCSCVRMMLRLNCLYQQEMGPSVPQTSQGKPRPLLLKSQSLLIDSFLKSYLSLSHTHTLLSDTLISLHIQFIYWAKPILCHHHHHHHPHRQRIEWTFFVLLFLGKVAQRKIVLKWWNDDDDDVSLGFCLFNMM